MDRGTFDINQIYLLDSTKTGKPYLNEHRNCLIFVRESDAKKKQETLPDTIVSPPKYYKFADLAALCYAAGADGITLCSKDKEETFPLEERMLAMQPYNHELCGNLLMLKQTKKQLYLNQLAFCNFIVPVKINNGDEVEIVYGIARHTTEEVGMLYVAFSDLDEFTLWGSTVPGWQPLKTDFRGLMRICGKHGIMLNPSGNRLVLTHEQLNTIPRGSQQQENKPEENGEEDQTEEKAKVGA